jgi:glycogen operon protein
MLLAGDELGRTQRGNNNAYCQDNEVSWIDWEHADYDLMSVVVRLLALRRRNRIFRRPAYLGDRLRWYRNDGERMADADWETPWVKAAAVFLSGSGIVPASHDQYLAFNPHCEALPFVIPHELGWGWRFHLCTAGRLNVSAFCGTRGLLFQVESHSLVVASRSMTSD